MEIKLLTNEIEMLRLRVVMGVDEGFLANYAVKAITCVTQLPNIFAVAVAGVGRAVGSARGDGHIAA